MCTKLLPGLYKWLPIIFGCHCRDDRSFHYKGTRFPICARCTGELAGMVAALPAWFLARPPVWALLLLMVPMVADGLVQRLTPYESGNLRRLVTGALFGYALVTLTLLFWLHGFRTGVSLGLRLRG